MKWIERQRYFVDFTLSSLWRRKWRNTSLIFVYTLVVFMISSVIFFAEGIRRVAGTLLDHAPEMVVQRMVAGRYETIPLSYAEKIKSIRGIRSVRTRLWGYYYHMASRTNYTLMVPEKTLPDDAVEVGDGVLRTWGTMEGDNLYFRAYGGEPLVLKIQKTFRAETDLITADLILASEATFRRICGVPQGFATDLTVEVRNTGECPTIAEKISRILPNTRTLLREEIQRTYSSLFDWRSGYVIVMLTGAVLAFFIFAWDKATGLSAEERMEIGILKALGWDTADILAMKFWEGLVISLTAFSLGVILGYIHVFLGSAPLFEHALKGWSILYPRFSLDPQVNAYQLAVLFFFTVVPYTLITIVPAWKVSVMDPDAVMR